MALPNGIPADTIQVGFFISDKENEKLGPIGNSSLYLNLLIKYGGVNAPLLNLILIVSISGASLLGISYLTYISGAI